MRAEVHRADMKRSAEIYGHLFTFDIANAVRRESTALFSPQYAFVFNARAQDFLISESYFTFLNNSFRGYLVDEVLSWVVQREDQQVK